MCGNGSMVFGGYSTDRLPGYFAERCAAMCLGPVHPLAGSVLYGSLALPGDIAITLSNGLIIAIPALLVPVRAVDADSRFSEPPF
jgi:hypothetical protein